MFDTFLRATLASTVAAGLLLAGAGQGLSPATAQTTTEKKPAEKKEPPKDPVVAVVNGEKVYLSDLETVKAMMPAQVQAMPTQMIFKPLLDQVIDTRLMAMSAKAQNLDEEPRFKQSMALLRERLLRDEYITKSVDSKITDDVLKPLYEEYKKNVKPEPEVNARHILVKEEKEAKAIIKDIQGGGDFAKIAKEKSTGPSKVNGGDLGWFSKGQMVGAFDEAVFKLEKGEVSKEPVKTRFGWHVIKVEDVRIKEAPSFEKVKPKLAEELHKKLYQEAVDKLRADAKVTKFNIDGSEVKAAPPKKPEAGEKKEEKKE